MKCFYGRYAGTEGTLKTEVVDTILLEVPDPRGISSDLAEKIESAMKRMKSREVTHLVEERMLQCHSSDHMREILKTPSDLPTELTQVDRRELDDAVLELIGVTDPEERIALIDELYRQTAEYYRYQRTQDIQSMENRKGNGNGQTDPRDLAASVWDSLTDSERGKPVVAWIEETWLNARPVDIPDGKASAIGAQDMFDPSGVRFKQGSTAIQRTYAHSAQAELAAELANQGMHGQISIPSEEGDCQRCLTALRARLTKAQARFAELAAARSGNQPMQEKVILTLMQWFAHGRS